MTDLYFEKVKLILEITALIDPLFHEIYTKNWKKIPAKKVTLKYLGRSKVLKFKN